MAKLVAFLSFFVGILYIQGVSGDWFSAEHQLYNDLLGPGKYNKNVRPVKLPNQTVVVHFGQTLLEIEELDIQTQMLTIHGWLKLTWTDQALTWSPEDYNDIAEMRLPITELWRPDIMLYNSRRLSLWESTEDVLAVVYAGGTVLWIPPVKLVVGCSLDLSRFPWDKHQCHLQFGSWTYDDTKLNLTWSGENDTVTMDTYKEHQEWELKDYSVKRTPKVYPCCPDQAYVDIKLNMSLARKGEQYMHLILLPSVALMFLLPTMFILPPDSGEKIQLGVGILVAQTLLLVAVENFLPSAHPTIPIVVKHFLANIILTGLSLSLNTIVVGAWAKSNRSSGVPRILRILFFGVLSRLLCVKRDTFMPVENQSPPGVNMRRLDLEESDPSPGMQDDDNKHMMQTYARLTTISEWRQLAVIIDRLLFLAFLIVACLVLFSMH